MILIDGLAFAASATILAAYLAVATERRPTVMFHLTNAIGCFPLGASAALHGAWPAFGVTAMFGIIGAVGVARWGLR